MDSYGVLRNYNGLIEGINETIQFLRANDILFFVLTNDASRGPKQLAEKFLAKGVKDIASEDIISSGMMAREYLRYKVKDGLVAYLGTEASAHYIEEAGLATIPIADLEKQSNGMPLMRLFFWMMRALNGVLLLARRSI